VFAQGKRDILKDRKIGKQRAVLKEHPHAPAHGVQPGTIQTCKVLTRNVNASRTGRQLPPQEAQNRGLAAARAAHQGDDLAGRKLHAHAIENQPANPPIGRTIAKRHGLKSGDGHDGFGRYGGPARGR
jgi:hypothetical protein